MHMLTWVPFGNRGARSVLRTTREVRECLFFVIGWLAQMHRWTGWDSRCTTILAQAMSTKFKMPPIPGGGSVASAGTVERAPAGTVGVATADGSAAVVAAAASLIDAAASLLNKIEKKNIKGGKRATSALSDAGKAAWEEWKGCLLYTSPSPRDS